MTWGFPCTDISKAGARKGFTDENNNKTRSGLYYDGIRILREKKPSVSIIENVKNLTGDRFREEFSTVLSDLDEAGYNSYWKVLNAKDFGVPQSRRRVFIVSIRRDVDNGKFEFPEGFESDVQLKDMLEEEVDERYYVELTGTEDIQPCGNTGTYPINTTSWGGCNALKASYAKISIANMTRKDGWGATGVCSNNRIRKLTPKECFRIMGFSDSDFERAKSAGVSNTHLYNQAGNSIVVDVLYYIFVELYKALPELFDDLRVGSFFSGIGAFESALDRVYMYIDNKK